MLRLYNQARELLKFPKLCPQDNEAFLGDLYLLRSVPELEGDPSTLPDVVHLVGDCLWEEPVIDAELSTWLSTVTATGRPLIYLQHGRFFELPSFWPTLVQICGKQKVYVAASLDRMDSPMGGIPPNFLVRPYLPQGKVLPFASAVVASANTTVVLGAVTSGVPSVLFTAGGEQPDVAEKCEAAGVAKVLHPELTSADELSSAINQVINDKYMKESAVRLSDAFSRIDSIGVASDLLEILSQQKKPVLRSQFQPIRNREHGWLPVSQS
jgi:UDP:flavonoid glycosyltransferase YjiC (YdhE family)